MHHNIESNTRPEIYVIIDDKIVGYIYDINYTITKAKPVYRIGSLEPIESEMKYIDANIILSEINFDTKNEFDIKIVETHINKIERKLIGCKLIDKDVMIFKWYRVLVRDITKWEKSK